MTGGEEAARRLYGAINAHDVGAIVGCWAPGGVERVPVLGELRAPEEIAAFSRELFAAIPDYEIEVLDLLADAGRAFARFRARGTFTGGPLFGLRPTGREWRAEGVDAIRLERGLIVELAVYADPIATAQGSGVLPRWPLAERFATGALNLMTRFRRF